MFIFFRAAASRGSDEDALCCEGKCRPGGDIIPYSASVRTENELIREK